MVEKRGKPKGYHPKSEFKKGHNINNGRIHSEKSKINISEGHKGKPSNAKGIKWTNEQRAKKSGENHWNWKGGITSRNIEVRNSAEYKDWRFNVFIRDNFTCQSCGAVGSCVLEAHHIVSLSKLLKIYEIKSSEQAKKCRGLWDINNGVTLCIDCHKKTDNWRGKAK